MAKEILPRYDDEGTERCPGHRLRMIDKNDPDNTYILDVIQEMINRIEELEKKS